MDESLTKRILISGLTPTITQDDLSRRLGSFGSVTALDGLGALDALGQPRKFAYATLATTKGKLAKCMNVLSGSTWKGAKLRIGEAKPDFRERIALENTPTDSPPRKRIRLARGVQGTHSADMSLVTPENVHLRPQWRVTALGRLVRPVRMRPMHPLDPPIDLSNSAEKRKGKGQKDKEAVKGKEEKPTKKRKREPPTRARRRTIDPLQWGSQHIVGVFLEGGNAAPGSTSWTDVGNETVDNGDEDSSTMGSSAEESSDEEGREGMVEDDPAIPEAHHTAIPPLDATSLPVARMALPLPTAPVVVAAAPITFAESTDLAQEAEEALDLLRSMFGDPDPDGADWGGAESVVSDVDVAELVPELQDAETGSDEPEEADGETKEPTDTAPMSADQIEPTGQSTKSGTQVKKLKDLFAPREEEAGFSLLNHLDLDFDLDNDLDLELSGGVILPISTLLPSASILPVPSQKASSSLASLLDPARPLFFPRRAAPLGAWRTRFAFHRTDTGEQIRSKWETERGELTREWKRRYREAVKSRRRRGGEDTAAGEAG